MAHPVPTFDSHHPKPFFVMKTKLILSLLAILAVLAACEKPLLDDAAPTAVGDSPGGGKDGGDSDVTPVTPEA